MSSYFDLLLLFSSILFVGGGIVFLNGRYRVGFYGNLGLTVAGVILIVLFFTGMVRAMLFFFPIREGDVPSEGVGRFVQNVYVLIAANIFFPVYRILPIFISAQFYRLQGARLGFNTYVGGILYDPFFVTIGTHGIVGAYALLVPHVFEGARTAYYPIRLGDHVTIGAHAIVMAGCTIGDGAVVAMNSVVVKHTVIGRNEIWGGTPARRLGIKSPEN